MYASAFRRVFKNLSPRKNANGAAAQPNATATAADETSSSSPSLPCADTPTDHRVKAKAAASADDLSHASAAVAQHYDHFLARISTRADGHYQDQEQEGDLPPSENINDDDQVEDDGRYSYNVDVDVENAQHNQCQQVFAEPNDHLPDLSVDGPRLSDSPPSTPPHAARGISRIHRRAVRDVTPFVDASSEDTVDNEDENARCVLSPVTPSSRRRRPGMGGGRDRCAGKGGVPNRGHVYGDEEEETVGFEDDENDNENANNANLYFDYNQYDNGANYGAQQRYQHPQEEDEGGVLVHTGVNPELHFSGFVGVGAGGSGSVFFATHNSSGERVALKRVTPSTDAKRHALETEIRTLHALRHGNIVRGYGAYAYGAHVWIVMEAMDVGCLTSVLDFLRGRRFLLSEAHVAYIVREVLHGLWAMHSRRWLHRDVKSDNVLVSSDGAVKLGDFEYSAVLTAGRPKRRTVVGTAWWMAPETARSSLYDYGADVWSIGILAIECAEWVPPLFGLDSQQALHVLRDASADPQTFRRPDMWSPQFADFVRGCLTRDRAERYTVPQLLRHPFLAKACTQTQIANVFRAVKGMPPL